METYNIQLDKREHDKVNKVDMWRFIFVYVMLCLMLQLSDDNGCISREDFLDYAKKSSGVKELSEKGFAHVGKTSVNSIKNNLDKAELAFKECI